MAWWTPLELGILRPTHRSEGCGIKFGDLILHQFHFTAFGESHTLITTEVFHGVIAGAKTIHQEQAHVFATDFAQVQNLVRHDVEKRRAIAHGQQALRSLQAHAGAKTAIELDHRDFSEQRRIDFALLLADLRPICQALGG